MPQMGCREGILEPLAWQGRLGSWWGWSLVSNRLRGVHLLPTCLSHPCLCQFPQIFEGYYLHVRIKIH